MVLNQVCCPYCNSEKCEVYQSYETLNCGNRKLYQCATCQRVFSETKGTFLEGLKKPISLIVKVLNARSEGMGLNAACRVFDIAKNTLLDWEQRFADLKETLMMYALMNTFLVQVIEGDWLYTKVGKNVPVQDCEGWTIVLMERASWFICALSCGKKDRQLFFCAIQMLRDVIERTGDVTLVTDGERRYGNLLFEICHEMVRSGQRGRPPKVLLQGVKVRLKNKGAQSRQRGRKRPKYEAPHHEHPQTRQDIANADIHADHVEAFNASTRRRLQRIAPGSSISRRNRSAAASRLEACSTWTTVASISRRAPENRAARQSGSRLNVIWPSGQYQRATRVPGGSTRS